MAYERNAATIAAEKAERALHAELKKRGARIMRSPIMDMRPYCVDLQVTSLRGRPLSRAVEIQITLELDNPHKMDQFLRAQCYAANAQRVYVELWDAGVAPRAADLLVQWITDWSADPGRAPPHVFLRVGPTGAVHALLEERINHVFALRAPTHPERRRGTLDALVKNHVRIRLADQTFIVIPLRHARKRLRIRLRELQARGKPFPKGQSVSFLPGRPDKSGIPVFFLR